MGLGEHNSTRLNAEGHLGDGEAKDVEEYGSSYATLWLVVVVTVPVAVVVIVMEVKTGGLWDDTLF